MWRSVLPWKRRCYGRSRRESFAQLCGRVLAEGDEDKAAITVMRYLQQWVADELLAAER